jgi:hypothetical protein
MAKPIRVTGMRMGQAADGALRMRFAHPETGRRYELVGAFDGGDTVDRTRWDVYAAEIHPEKLLPVEGIASARPRWSADRALFFAFVDPATRERYVVYFNLDPRYPDSPDWSACWDQGYARLRRVTPPAPRRAEGGNGAEPAGGATEAGELTLREAAATVPF